MSWWLDVQHAAFCWQESCGRSVTIVCWHHPVMSVPGGSCGSVNILVAGTFLLLIFLSCGSMATACRQHSWVRA